MDTAVESQANHEKGTLPAMCDYRGCSSFFFAFMFLSALKPVDFDDIVFQVNPIGVIQVAMVNKFSHRALQLLW